MNIYFADDELDIHKKGGDMHEDHPWVSCFFNDAGSLTLAISEGFTLVTKDDGYGSPVYVVEKDE